MRNRNAPLTVEDVESLAWAKMGDLLPAAVQDRRSGQVLMLGYMNREALLATLGTGSVTFWRRSTKIATTTHCSSSPTRKARPAIAARRAASARQ